jgi:hypothetical protein
MCDFTELANSPVPLVNGELQGILRFNDKDGFTLTSSTGVLLLRFGAQEEGANSMVIGHLHPDRCKILERSGAMCVQKFKHHFFRSMNPTADASVNVAVVVREGNAHASPTERLRPERPSRPERPEPPQRSQRSPMDPAMAAKQRMEQRKEREDFARNRPPTDKPVTPEEQAKRDEDKRKGIPPILTLEERKRKEEERKQFLEQQRVKMMDGANRQPPAHGGSRHPPLPPRGKAATA